MSDDTTANVDLNTADTTTTPDTVVEPPDLISQLPDDLKDNETFKDMDVGKLATSYIDIQSKVPVLPENADGYNFDFPEDVPFQEADHKVFKDFALEIGLTQDQFARLNEFDIQRIGRMMESLEAKREDNWKQIRQNTGLEKAEIDKQVEEVSRALKLEKLTQRLDLMADPDFANAMLNLKKLISEDSLKISTPGGKTRPTGPDGTPRLKFPSMGDD